MKRLPSILLILGSHVASAQSSFEGMKQDVLGEKVPAQSTNGLMPLLQLGLIVGVLFCLIKFVMPKLIAKMTNRLSTGLDSSIRVEESATIGTGGLYVIGVRGRTLLVGASSQGNINLVADLTQDQKREEAEPAFFELVDQAIIAEPTTEEPSSEVAQRLEMLIKGAGRR